MIKKIAIVVCLIVALGVGVRLVGVFIDLLVVALLAALIWLFLRGNKRK